jgi:hypothetical protein
MSCLDVVTGPGWQARGVGAARPPIHTALQHMEEWRHPRSAPFTGRLFLGSQGFEPLAKPGCLAAPLFTQRRL